MSLSALSLLGTLNRLGPMAATRLAVEERLQPQSLTRLLLALEEAKLILRTRSADDRRAFEIAVTARGQRALAKDLERRRDWLDRVIATTLTDSEREALFTASNTLMKIALYDPTMINGGRRTPG